MNSRMLLLSVSLAVGALAAQASGAQDKAAPGSFEAGLEAYDAAVASKQPFHAGFKQAFEIWLPLAEQEDLKARYHVGILHYFGAGGIEIDQVKGFRFIREAAQGDYPTAQAFLGLLSEHGDGMFQKRGPQEAAKWYGRAAEGGHCQGLKRMVQAYSQGELGLQKDAEAAARLRAKLPGCTRR